MLDPNVKAILPAIIRETMETLHQLTNAPDEMTLPITLSVANFAAQSLYNVNPIAWPKAPVSEFFVVLVPSGGMKTSVSDYLMDGIRKYEKQEEIRYKDEIIDYDVAMKRFKKAIDEYVKKSVGVNKPSQPTPPRGFKVKLEKFTTNGLLDTLDESPFAGLFSSDAGEFFNSHSFQENGKSMEIITALSKLWSGEMVERLTGIKETNVRLHDRRFNMLVMLQQQLAGFLKNPQYKDQGFTNRMLITQCELFNKLERTFEPEELEREEMLREKLDVFNMRVFDLLCKSERMQEKARTITLGTGASLVEKMRTALGGPQAGPNELILDKISFEEKARPVMRDFYNKCEKMRYLKKYSDYTNFLSRLYEHACRLAATLAIFEQRMVIEECHALAGVELALYFLEQRLNLEVDGDIKTDPIVEAADELHKKMLSFNKLKGICDFDKKWFNNFGPSSYRKSTGTQREKIITELISRDLIELVEEPTDKIYLVNRAKRKHIFRLVDE